VHADHGGGLGRDDVHGQGHSGGSAFAMQLIQSHIPSEPIPHSTSETCSAVVLRVVFGIEAGTGPRHRGSKLIHPESPFATVIQIMSMLLLVYTALYTPVTVGFYWNTPPCYRSPTLEFDVFLDSFFLFEIVVNFFIGVDAAGMYVDEQRIVAMNYLRVMRT